VVGVGRAGLATVPRHDARQQGRTTVATATSTRKQEQDFHDFCDPGRCVSRPVLSLPMCTNTHTHRRLGSVRVGPLRVSVLAVAPTTAKQPSRPRLCSCARPNTAQPLPAPVNPNTTTSHSRAAHPRPYPTVPPPLANHATNNMQRATRMPPHGRARQPAATTCTRPAGDGLYVCSHTRGKPTRASRRSQPPTQQESMVTSRVAGLVRGPSRVPRRLV
jgi:hypothetical protein